MNFKERYQAFCDLEKDIPIFSQPWWLDLVCGCDNWDALIVEKGGEIKAVMPIYIKMVSGNEYIVQPPLTPALGPYIKYPINQSYYKKLSWEKDLMDDLISRLPKYAYFEQHFSSEVTNWQPFYWSGFEQTSRYTYILECESFADFEASRLTSSRKRRIRKAQKSGVEVVDSSDVKMFYELNQATFARRGIEIPYSFRLVKSLYDEGVKKGAVKILLAKYNDKYIAGSFLVKDAKRYYYLMGGIDSSFPDVGAMDLVQYRGIELALNEGKKFDFEGSMMPSIEKYFRSFGAEQQQYSKITKTNSKALLFKRFIREVLR